MKKYIVKYRNQEESFEDIHAACKRAEQITEEEKVFTQVFSETNGIRSDEAFLECCVSI